MFKKKIFIIVAFIVLLTTINSCVFASDDTYPTISGLQVKDGYTLDNYIIMKTDRHYLLVFPHNYGKVLYDGSNIWCSSGGYFLIYYESGNSWNYSNSAGKSSNNSGFVCSSVDIYKDDMVFFPPPPLTKIMKVEGEKQTIQKTLVGLVPLVIGFLVLAIALAKALKMLQTLFQHS